jgi:hypothetical protein
MSTYHDNNSLTLMLFRLFTLSLMLFTAVLFTACEADDAAVENSAPFTLLREAETGLSFKNTLTQSPEFNVFNYMYFYNGGGLAAGDFNQDGLIDLYFTSNMEENKLFLNEGDLHFREAGAEAGVAGQPGWATGASVVDINQDGLLDIYVSQVGDYLTLKGHNQLYVCQEIKDGVPIFKEEAAAYGLDLVGFGTQAAFFDYDGDGDLDMYQLNHSLHQNGTFGKRMGLQGEPHPLSGDRLMRNDGGRFTDVTRQANIMGSVVGYGLGLAVGDLNADGWPDLYVGNDFHENDYLYLNHQDGTFREVLTEQISHTSRFSMGVDIADINNDGNADIISLDMLPEDPFILKSSLGEDGFDVFKFKLGFGYNPQFSRNTLQLNNGNGSYQEIGAFAGVYATDWSWAPLFFDMNHDGKRDLFISNGIPRRMNDIDYINFKTNDDLKYKESFNDINKDDLSFIDMMPEIKLDNKFFVNTGQLRFTDLSATIKDRAVSYSSSAIYADLDNDGDLDVVTNNIDDEPFVYRNNQVATDTTHYLQLRLNGQAGNRQAIGATAIVFAGKERMVYEHYPTKGYQSSSQGPLHLGLGDAAKLDSIVLVWPDRSYQRLPLTTLDTVLTLSWRAGLAAFDYARLPTSKEVPVALMDVTKAAGITYVHQENPFVDFSREPLIPFMVSTEGPALAVGDVNGDGLEDFFVGSSKRLRSTLYLQQADGTFRDETPAAFIRDSVFEDVDAVFADVENDGDLDLIIAAGGNEYFAEQEARKQRAYLNDGAGNFSRADLFPDVYMTASKIVAADFNGDGLVDFFLGGRVVPRSYGVIPESYLMINEGGGVFRDRTDELAPGLKLAGLVKDATAADIDGDGDADLVLAMGWQPITVFRNDGGQFTAEQLHADSGWWNSLNVADMDGDGDMDVLAGNFGANNKLKPTPEQPLTMYVNDFDDNETLEQVLTYYVKGREIPFATHAELTKQLPGLKKRYLYAQEMAKDDLSTIFGQEKLAGATKFQATTLESLYLENSGSGQWTTHQLPDRAQFSTIHAAGQLPAGAGSGTRWLIGGNFLGSNIEMGWYDASMGQVLEIGADGVMQVRPVTGVMIDGEVRNMRKILSKQSSSVLIGRNNGALKLVRED